MTTAFLLLACAGGLSPAPSTPAPAAPVADPVMSDRPAETLATAPATEPACPAAPFAPLTPFDPDDFLCDISGPDPAFPACEIAYGGASDRDPAQVPARLTVVTWNVEFAANHAEVIQTLRETPELAAADFLLLQEVARVDGESDPQWVDQAADIADALGMYFAFATEWDRREVPALGGEHGEAVLSKYPLGNPALVRHLALNDWYAEDRVYGGRISLGVDALVGCELVRLYSSHLDTRGIGDAGRAAQGAETRDEADRAGHPPLEIVAGDLNTWLCNPLVSDCGQPGPAEQVVEDYLAAGWADVAPDFDSWTQLGEGFFPQRLDWMFQRGLTDEGWIVLQAADGSDHAPLVWSFSLPESP
jgi:endonuclease/exonuclease/phosphatase family metal-dependent hydrolase